jgi:hypothetical protein
MSIELMRACRQAAETGDIPSVEKLIPQHAQVASRAFWNAAECDQFELLSHLVTHHRDRISSGTLKDALFSALTRRSERRVLFLLANGAELDEPVTLFQETPLIVAAREGMTAVVSELIKRGANLEKRDRSLVAKVSGAEEGDTALIKATRWDYKTGERGRIEAIKLLIAAGADVNAIGESGKTALDRANASAKREEIKQLLLAAGAKTAKELRPARPVPAAPKPKPRQPAAGITNFAEASALLASLCGSKPQAHPQIAGARFFQFRPAAGERAPIGKALLKRLEQIRHEAAPQIGKAGCWVVRTLVSSTGLGLCLLRAKDKFDVVKQFNFGSGGWGVTTAAALKFLRALDRTASFTLLACDQSALAGRFQARPKSGLALAKSLHGFCPFVCDDFDDDVKTLAKHLERGGEFTLWWD